MIHLEEKSSNELATWLPAMMAHYIAERIKAGESEEDAYRVSEMQFGQLFPKGHLAEGQHVMNVVADEVAVGTLWMGRPFSGDEKTWFVFDIEITEDARGRGIGRAAMEAAEVWTREHGGTRVALNVFGPNLIARSLYDSLGYEVQSTSMFKDL
jgi:ribosomal protein S18 acetylase RimI-like enzyme